MRNENRVDPNWPGSCQTDGTGERQPADRRSLAVLLVVIFLSFMNYAALLAVVPMWALTGGAADVAVGATTGVMMVATVATQLAAPMLFKFFRLREMMMIGAVLLGAPTPLYIFSVDIAWILGITAVRGMGFALVVISGATLIADIAVPEKLSSTASLYGTAAALPNLGALAGGVWIADVWGFALVFWSAGLVCLLGVIASIALPKRAKGAFNIASAADVRRICVPVGLLLLTAASFGAVTTFLPVSEAGAAEVSLALLGASAALLGGRLGAGFLGDRIGTGRLLIVSVLITASGLALISEGFRDVPALLTIGAVLLGAGFGICQNDSFVTTVERLGPARTGAASTLWNMTYDGGLGIGAVALGWSIAAAGYADSLLMMAVVVVTAALLLKFILFLQDR